MAGVISGPALLGGGTSPAEKGDGVGVEAPAPRGRGAERHVKEFFKTLICKHYSLPLFRVRSKCGQI